MTQQQTIFVIKSEGKQGTAQLYPRRYTIIYQ